MVKVRRPETAPFSRYFRFCNVLRLWSVRAIPTYRVYRLYDGRVHNLNIWHESMGAKCASVSKILANCISPYDI